MGPFAVPEIDFGPGKLHHVGIVVPDSDAAVQHFEDLYGLPIRLLPESHYHCRIDGVAHSTVQRLGLSIEGPPHVELLREVPESTVWHSRSGVHHLGFVVDDLAAASAELERRGSPLWMGGLAGGQCPVGTAYHRDSLGLTIELLDAATAARLATRLNEAR
ncbi:MULTISPECIES: VOC family protein [Rhodococcus]|uniref:VOC family protein n=1 Tax=Rhodococcus parequi TaxID=3137122 RepID=A0ABW9FH63_9NOCA